jgi:hypothetical protein
MKSLLDINVEYLNIIQTKKEKEDMKKKLKYYLDLKIPMNISEKKEFEKISYIIQLQREIEQHNKKRNRLINKSILVI